MLITSLFQQHTGKYYLVDSAYPNSIGFLAPYIAPTVRKHIPEFKKGRRCGNFPSGMEELFNYRHASLCGVIERTFGVLKSTWKIVDDRMPQMNLNSQLEIVIAVCTVHNFMRLHESGIPITRRPPSSNCTTYVGLFDNKSKKAMDNFRNQLALEIAES